MLNTLKELCLLNGVSGDEDEVRRYITAKAVKHATNLRADPLGNLIVFKKGKKSTENRLMLCAHMDEVGVIVTRITDEGFLKFDFVGGWTAGWPLASRWSSDTRRSPGSSA